MDNIKDDRYYIDKILENIDVIISYTKGIEYENFVNNILLLDAVMFRLIQMVENIIHISKDYKDQYSNINWKQIVGFRNNIVHDYGKVDYSLVYEVISNDIYDLRDNLMSSVACIL